MDLNRSVRKFSQIPLDGWNGTAWVTDVAKGTLEVYSRFITERTFGAVKRIMMCPDPIPTNYTVLRTPDGERYLVAFLNKDIAATEVYNHVYILQLAVVDAKVVSRTYAATASGMAGAPTDNLTIDLPCYLERYSATSSTAADDVLYSRFKILLPKGTALTTDDEVQVGTTRYHIGEVDTELDLVRAYTVEQ